MHVGGIRTALFAYAYAKKNDGQFVLRIEDTDKEREVEGSIEHIQEAMNWLGITSDEEPAIQSKRLEIYREWAQKLIDRGLAYTDPYTKEEVDKFREEAKTNNKAFLYRDFRPDETSASSDWYGKLPLRFKVENIEPTDWQDEVWGEMHAGAEALDDFVMIKADGFPTYNFAHVIDDHLMGVTHVMRGEEFLPSVPKFIALHRALEIDLPKFVTMPFILSPGGGKKLSKRDGAKDVLDYRDEGILPEAFFNFIASLGWNDGTEQEVFSPQEIIDSFEVSRIQKSGAQFNDEKLAWFNWQHIKLLAESDSKKLFEHLKKVADFDGNASDEALNLAISKSNNIEDLVGQLSIFSGTPDFSISSADLTSIDSGLNSALAKKYLDEAAKSLESLEDFTTVNIEKTLRQKMSDLSASPRAFLNLVRWAISGRQVSPNLFEMIRAVGKEDSISRLKAAV